MLALVACGSNQASASNAKAPDWLFVNEGMNNGVKFYLDANSVVVAGIYRSATVKAVHGPKTGGGHVIEENAYDCTNRTVTLLAVASYKPDGKLLTSMKFEPSEHGAGKPESGSVGESLLNAACEY